MDLSTNYLGLNLKSPLMPGASPLVDSLDMVRRLEDAGAAAIVMHSLFEEQITGEKPELNYYVELYTDGYAEALKYFPKQYEYPLAPQEYLAQLDRIKRSVSIPVIASLNGATVGWWTEYARLIEQAGADALELNTYFVATDTQETGFAVEQRILEVVRAVTESVSIPVAVKVSPFFSSFANFAARLDEIGVDGIVMFNRFYQPDIDIETLDVKPTLRLSDSSELLLRLRWLAILARQISASLCVSGGVHTGVDAIKSGMVGADAVQVVSALLRYGPEFIGTIERSMRQWMEQNGYASLRQIRGSLSLSTCRDPQAFERANYVRTLHSFAGMQRVSRP